MLYEQWAEELEFPFRRCGILTIATDDEQAHQIETLYQHGIQNRVPYMQILSGERVLEQEPNLTPDVREAIYAPTGGIVEPYEMIFAIVENAQKNGLELVTNAKVDAIEAISGGLRVMSGSQEWSARFVINAAGLYADEVSRMAGAEDFNINPRKGEEYLLDKRAGALVNSVIFPIPTKKSKGILVIPTVDGTMMLGPTATEVEDKEDKATTAEGLRYIFEHVRPMVPAIQLRDIITAFVGLRPTLATEDFYIARSQKVPTLIQAAGIQSPGLTAAPAIAEMVKDILLQAGLPLAESPTYDPHRPAGKKIRHCDLDELDRLIAKTRPTPEWFADVKKSVKPKWCGRFETDIRPWIRSSLPRELEWGAVRADFAVFGSWKSFTGKPAWNTKRLPNGAVEAILLRDGWRRNRTLIGLMRLICFDVSFCHS